MDDMERRLIKLGAYLTELRMKKGVSQKEASKWIGISNNYLSELERAGKNRAKEPSDEILRKIATYYGINEDAFFYILGKVPPSARKHIKQYSPSLLSILSEVERNSDLTDEQRRSIEEKIKNIYKKYLERD